MSSVFLSFSAQDGTVVANRVATSLEAAGYSDIYVFNSSLHGTPSGEAWEPAVLARLMTFDALVVISTPKSRQSPRCNQEIALARHRVIPIVEVAVDDIGNPLLADLHRIAASDPAEAAVRVVNFLKRQEIDPEERLQARTPYPGLLPFDEDRAYLFYGRQQDIKHVVFEVDFSTHDGGALAVVGPSGVGKSSLVRAGVIPHLRRSKDLRYEWQVESIQVADDGGIEQLLGALARLAGHTGDKQFFAELAKIPNQDRASNETLLADCLPPQSRKRRLIVLDQAEALLAAEPKMAAAFATITQAVIQNNSAWFICTLRADFLDKWLEHPGLNRLAHRIHPLAPLDRDTLFEVIAEPARKFHWEYEPEALTAIVEDVPDAESLPLLAYALHELWSWVNSTPRFPQKIRLDDYKHVGRVAGMITARADVAFRDACEIFAKRQSGATTGTNVSHEILSLLRTLVTVNADGQFTRRKASRTDLEAKRHLLEPFVVARVLTAGGDSSIQISHEALLRQWPLLADELTRVAGLLRLCSDVERRAASWAPLNRPTDALMPATALVGLLAALDTEFPSSDAASQSETVANLTALGVSAEGQEYVFDSLQEVLDREVDRGLREAQARPDVALQSLSGAGSEIQRSVIHILLRAPDVRPLIRLVHYVMAAYPVQMALQTHDGGAWAVRWSPDGTRFATAGRDQSTAIWNSPWLGPTASTPAQRCPHGEESNNEGVRQSWVRSVTWAASGLLLSGATDKTVRVWAADSGADIRVLNHEDRLWAVDAPATPIGRVLTGQADGGLRTYRVARPFESEPEFSWKAPAGLYDAALAADGRHVAVACRNNNLYVFDIEHLEQPPASAEHPEFVRAVGWSPTTDLVATGCQDHVIRIFRRADLTLQTSLLGHSEQVRAVRWSRQGNRIASASADRSIRIWDVATKSQVVVHVGHDQGVCDVDWSPAGDVLLSAADDGRVLLWHIGPESTVVCHLEGQATTICASDDSGEILVAIADKTGASSVVIVDRQGTVRPTQVRHSKSITSVQRVGDDILTASRDQRVVLWQSDGSSLEYRPADTVRGPMTGALRSPDGRHTVAVNEDKVIRRWRGPYEPLDDGAPEIHKSFLRGVAWSHQSDRFAVVSEDRLMTVHDISTDEFERFPLSGLGVVVAWHPSGDALAVGMKDGNLEIHTFNGPLTLASREVWQYHTVPIHALAWSQDGTMLCSTAASGPGAVWDYATGAVRTTLIGHSAATTGCFWGGPLTVITCGMDKTIRSWDLSGVDDHPLAGLPSHTEDGLPKSRYAQLLIEHLAPRVIDAR